MRDHRVDVIAVILGLFVTLAAGIAHAQVKATTRPTLDADLGVDYLINVLDEPAWGDREMELFRKRQALRAISATLPGARKTVPSLLALLHDRGTGRLAAEALVRLGDTAREETLKAARDPDAAVRADVVRAIPPIGRDAEPLLAELSRADPDPAVRSAATEGLLTIGSPEAAPVLIAMLRTGSIETRIEAAQAIYAHPQWKLTDDIASLLAEHLGSIDMPLRYAAMNVLEREHAHPKQVLEAAYHVAQNGADGGVAGLRVIAAYPVDARAVHVAVRCLNSRNGQASQCSIDMLRRAGFLALIDFPALAGIASHSGEVHSGNVRQMLFELCSKLPGNDEPLVPQDLAPMTSEQLVRSLEQVAADGQCLMEVRAIALEPLSRWSGKGRAAIPAAVQILRSRQAASRDLQVAVRFLTNHMPAGAEADAAVVAAMESDSESLGSIGEQYLIAAGPAIHPTIVRLLYSPRTGMQLAAIRVCGRLPKPESLLAPAVTHSALDGSGDVQSEALRVLQAWVENHPTAEFVKDLSGKAPRFQALVRAGGRNAEPAAAILAVVEPPPPAPSMATVAPASTTVEVTSARRRVVEPQTIIALFVVLTVMGFGALAVPRLLISQALMAKVSQRSATAALATSGVPSAQASGQAQIKENRRYLTIEKSCAKAARCEKCSREYGYDVVPNATRAKGGLTGPLALVGGIIGALIGALIDSIRNAELSEHRRRQLDGKVDALLDSAVEVVACPDCGWHQRDMVLEAQKRTRRSDVMKFLIAMTVVSFIATLLLFSIRADRYSERAIPAAAVWLAASAFGIFLTTYMACWAHAGRLSVNSGWPISCSRCKSRHAQTAQFCRRCGSTLGSATGTVPAAKPVAVI